MVSPDKNSILNKKQKKQDLFTLLLSFLIIISVNIISSYVYTRFDLTTEKRYTLSNATKEFIKNLDDVVYVKVYLEGDFPAGFKRLRNATREMLDEFKAYANDNIEYEFIDPSTSPDQKERNQLYRQLANKGLQPTNLEERGKEETSQKIIFPGAIFTYKGKEVPLQLLKSSMGSSSEEMLNNSIQGLEYEMANTIRELTINIKSKIGFLRGHGELSDIEVADITRSLSEFYEVDTVSIQGRLNSLRNFKAIIIAKPSSAFDEKKDKFILDQYIMNGGKILWLIDPMSASMDSLIKSNTSISVNLPLNLEDQLFKYGARINSDIILDLQCAPIPIITGYTGNQPQQSLLPWYFFPLIVPTSNHPIVNNLNAIKCEFVSSIDTVAVKNVTKTILLTTSKYTKLLYSPVRIGLSAVKEQPKLNQYNKPNRTVALLLEGKFTSVFTNRILPSIREDKSINFKEESVPTKMIVISDGDIIKNQIHKSSGNIFPLGYDRYTGQTYGNKNFILNCIDYLCDESGLIGVRSKELKLRLLNNTKIDENKYKWQIIGVSLPILLIIFFGLIYHFIRKRKYIKVL